MAEMVAAAATDADREDRTPRDVEIPEKAIVVGVGGVGSWVALGLAIAGVQELHLIDGDHVEVHNLNRLPVHPRYAGTSKPFAIADIIKSVRPDIVLRTYNRPLSLAMLRWLASTIPDAVLFDCTDTPFVQRITTHWPGRRVRAGCEGWQAQATQRGPAPWGDQTGGYSVPTWVAPAMAAAALGIAVACDPNAVDRTLFIDMKGGTR